MKLILRLTDHDRDTGQSRTLEAGRLSIGRGPQNDWVLADPDRTLSKNHCRIDASDGGFMLTDLSTNGVFMTGTSQPIGRGHSVALDHGESFSIGMYRLTAEIAGQSAGLMLDEGLGLSDEEPGTVFAGGSGRPSSGTSPLAPSIPEPWLSDVPGGEFGPGRRAAPQGWDAPPDPATYAATGMFDAPRSGMGAADSNPFTGPDTFSQNSEHLPAASTVMRIPQTQVVLPTNWMEVDPLEPAGEATPASWPPALPEEISAPNQDAAPAAAAPAPLPAARLPADWIADAPAAPRLPEGWDPAPVDPPPPVSFLAPPEPAAFKPLMPAIAPRPPAIDEPPAPLPAIVPPAPVAVRPAAAAPQPAAAPPIVRPTPRPARPASGVRPAAAPPAAPQTAVQSPPPATTPPSAAARSAARAFLEGAGLPPDTLDGADTDAAFNEIGRMVRAAVEGVRDILSTRALVKSEFRVDQTVLRRSDNNAVKFAPDVQRCLAAMVGTSPPGFLPGPAAMQQSMDDIKAHELALVAALNSVFADMGQQLDPEAIMRRARQDTSIATMLPYAREAKAWAIYTETYRILQDSGAANTAGSLLAPLAQAYARQLRRGG